VDSTGHVVSFAGPGTGAEPPLPLPLTTKDKLLIYPDRPIALPVRLYNTRGTAQTNISAEISSPYPTVRVLRGRAVAASIGPGEAVDLSEKLQVQLTAGEGELAQTRLQLKITYDDWHVAW